MSSVSIHETRYGTHEVRYREGVKQRSRTFKDLSGPGGAEEFAADLRRRLEEGRPVVRRKDVPTLSEFATRWLAGRVDLEDSTEEQYARWLATHILPDLGHLRLVDLRPRRLAEWQQQRLDDGAGRAVLGKAQALLSQILDTAVLPHEYLEANPVAALKRPATRAKPHRWLTAPEVELIRRWYLARDDIGSATLVSILAYIGIRPQDALALRWRDLGARLSVTHKVTGGEVKPGSKTGLGYRRTVYVPRQVAEDLAEWREVAPRRSLMFARATDGKPWTKTDWDNWRSRTAPKKRREKGQRPKCFKVAAEDVGLGRSLKPYDLRHTAATLFAAAGWTHVDIAHQLGHSPEVSMRTYQHLLEGARVDERRSIEDYIDEARGLSVEALEAKLDA
jgi:integrase